MKWIVCISIAIGIRVGFQPSASEASVIDGELLDEKRRAIFTQASKEKSSQICMKLLEVADGKNNFDNCIMHIVYLTKDVSHCAKLKNEQFESRRPGCFGLAADVNNDEKICNEFSSQKEPFEVCHAKFRLCNGESWKNWATNIWPTVNHKRIFKTEQRRKDCASRPKESTPGNK